MTVELDPATMAALPKKVAVWFDPQTGKVMDQGIYHQWDKTGCRAHFPVFLVLVVDGEIKQADICWESGNTISVRNAVAEAILACGPDNPGKNGCVQLVDARSNVLP